jgi:hypothetical protein
MLENTADAGSATAKLCKPFPLECLRVRELDKLGNLVQEILWLGTNYAIYRSNKGVYVHFSNCQEEEKNQRKKFTAIAPELCELRYLTTELATRAHWWRSAIRWPGRSAPEAGGPSASSDRKYALFEHNMGQALMLRLEDEANPAEADPAKPNPANEIAKQALAMAVQRVTNDNTIRYLIACLACGAVLIAIGFALFWLMTFFGPDATKWNFYVVAGMFGAIGAVFSIATRLQALELKPCHQSNMNYWMSAIRVGMGVVAAIVLLLLFASTTVGQTIVKQLIGSDMTNGVPWETAAILGFIAGFAERLVPNLLHQTIDKIESPSGTPVQAFRSQANAK